VLFQPPTRSVVIVALLSRGMLGHVSGLVQGAHIDKAKAFTAV
jgi:hypothetical protein